ncbi:11820_t:CDS:1, partial [Racocetra fulgida]
KFTSYWAHLNESSTISGLLDPCNKLSTFDIYKREQAINKLHELHKKYRPTKENQPFLPPTTTKSTCTLFRNLNQSHQADLNQYKIDKYLTEIETEVDSLLWWKANVAQFPTLSRLAMDFLTVQAISVLSKQAFSVAKHTI